MERKWRNPSEVMKMRKKKQQRSSTQQPLRVPATPSGKENSCLPLSSSLTSPGPPPGAVEQKTKRTPLGLRTGEDNSPRSPPSAKRAASNGDGSSSPHAKKLRAAHLVDVTEDRTTAEEEGNPPLSEARVPLDWTLRTKARFTSAQPFSWTAAIKSHQEARGLTSFVRGVTEQNLEPQSELQCHLMVWTHPSLPFLRLYPRTENRLNLTNASASQNSATAVATLLQDSHVLRSLKDDWATSFQSIFHLLRTGHCPYFYLCGNSFTVLFRASGVGASSQPLALLTPTTSGFRQALRKEGVEFSLPLAPGSPSESEELASLGDSETEDDTAASNWLQSMGLQLQDHSGATEKIALQKARSTAIDNRPESMVVVSGSHLHAFVNFLLTSKTTVATTGALAGVPPTLLAPVAFEGASLKSLKVKQGIVQEHVAGKLTRLHSLDINGPILPHILHGLCGLLEKTQQGDFSVHFNCNEATTAFNCDTKDSSTDSAHHHQPHLGLPPDSVPNRTALRELKCINNCYTWIAT